MYVYDLHTESKQFAPVDRVEQIVEREVAGMGTRLACHQRCAIGVRPTRFDTFATCASGALCVVKIVVLAAVRAVSGKMELGDGVSDGTTRRVELELGAVLVPALEDILAELAVDVVREVEPENVHKVHLENDK